MCLSCLEGSFDGMKSGPHWCGGNRRCAGGGPWMEPAAGVSRAQGPALLLRVRPAKARLRRLRITA